jgi:hypothetical protein
MNNTQCEDNDNKSSLHKSNHQIDDSVVIGFMDEDTDFIDEFIQNINKKMQSLEKLNNNEKFIKLKQYYVKTSILSQKIKDIQLDILSKFVTIYDIEKGCNKKGECNGKDNCENKGEDKDKGES